MKTQKFQLKNGLTVLLVESHKSPVVSVQMWVRTGSADEKKGEEGISHFIEHLVFKGTRKFKVGEIASMIEGSGGELNAYTSFDQTVFYVTISKQFSDTGLLAISEMMGFPQFDPTEIDNEREVVIEEIKRGQDSLGRRASQLMFSTAFQKHPYRIPVIGYEKNIREVSAKTLTKYYHNRYTPRNMFLVVVGDFKSPEMKKQIGSHFGEFTDYKFKKVKRTAEPVQKQTKIAVENAGFEQSVGYISWKVPGLRHKDTPALDVLAAVLGQGDSSRLVKKLRIDSIVANSIGSSVYAPEDNGLFLISAGYQKENFETLLIGIQESIEEFFKNPIEAFEIERAVLSLETEKFFSVETVDGIARNIGSQWFSAKDLKFQEKYMKAVRKLKASDLKKVAKKYLKPEVMTLAFVSNEEKSKVESQVEKWSKNYKTFFKGLKVSITKNTKLKLPQIKTKLGRSLPQAEKVTLANGVKVLLYPSKETYITTIKAAYLGGLRNEKEEQSGLTELLAKTWACGTSRRTEDEISQESDKWATGVQTLSGRNSIGISMEVLSAFEKSAADLFLDILTKPQFPTAQVDREKQIQIREIQTKKDYPSSIAGREFSKAIFEGHPYSRDLMGDEASVQALSSKDLQKHWNLLSQRKNLTLVLAGNYDKNFWLKAIEKATQSLGPGAEQNQKFSTPVINRERNIFAESKKEQSHVMYGFQGLTITSPERYTLQIIQSILAGQGGRLFLELRDKNSLAYSVSPIKMEGIETGYFGAYIGCSPEKVEKAISMIKEQFELLMTEKVSEEELLRAQRYLIGRHDIDLQRTSAIASSLLYDDIYGVDYRETFKAAEKYFDVGVEDIMSLAKRIFSQKPVITVVGPQNPWEQKTL